MKCTECGKEIPDGENTLCEDCQKKQVSENIKEEKVETKAEVKEEVKKEEKKADKKETKKEKKPKAEKKPKEEKPKKEKTKKEGKSFIELVKAHKIACLVALAVLVILVVLIVVFASMGKTSKVGNTIGNIRNYGYGASDGNWIYYLAPNEESTKVGIYKIKNNGEEKTELLMNDLDVVSINAYKDYVFFIGIGMEGPSEEDTTDNKIYRMKTDGSDLTVINDNEFHNECYEIYATQNGVFYIGTDSNIYKMDLDGSNKRLVSDNGTGYIGITDKYIIYNVEDEELADYVTYIMDIDGQNPRPILEDSRLYSVDISGDYVYYTDNDKQVCRTKIDSGVSETILEATAYNLNLNNNYLYFLNYTDAENEDYSVCLYRIKADGSQKEPETVKKLASYSSYIDVVGDWVMYMDYDEVSTFINFVKVDGSEENKVFNLQYESFVDETEQPEDVSAEEQTEPTVATPEGETTTPEVPADTNAVAPDATPVQ